MPQEQAGEHGGERRHGDQRRHRVAGSGRCSNGKVATETTNSETKSATVASGGAEGAYAGYLGGEAQPWEDWAEQACGGTLDRLCDLEAEDDPDGVFGGSVSL
jgi:hypothetical protein